MTASRRLKEIATAATFIFAVSMASQADGQTEVTIAHGRAAFYGDLSTQKSTPAWLVQSRLQMPTLVSKDSWMTWFFGLEMFQTKTIHEHSRFPFPAKSDLHFVGFFFSTGTCMRGTEYLAACASIGQGTLNTNADDNRQDYGTWNYQLDLKYEVTPVISVAYLVKKIGDIEQTTTGRASHFWLVVQLMGVSYSF